LCQPGFPDWARCGRVATLLRKAVSVGTGNGADNRAPIREARLSVAQRIDRLSSSCITIRIDYIRRNSLHFASIKHRKIGVSPLSTAIATLIAHSPLNKNTHRQLSK
jgi:hypothetical protein